jgi:hypothetical protein
MCLGSNNNGNEVLGGGSVYFGVGSHCDRDVVLSVVLESNEASSKQKSVELQCYD